MVSCIISVHEVAKGPRFVSHTHASPIPRMTLNDGGDPIAFLIFSPSDIPVLDARGVDVPTIG